MGLRLLSHPALADGVGEVIGGGITSGGSVDEKTHEYRYDQGGVQDLLVVPIEQLRSWEGQREHDHVAIQAELKVLLGDAVAAFQGHSISAGEQDQRGKRFWWFTRSDGVSLRMRLDDTKLFHAWFDSGHRQIETEFCPTIFWNNQTGKWVGPPIVQNGSAARDFAQPGFPALRESALTQMVSAILQELRPKEE